MSLTLCPHSVMSFFLRKQLEDSNVFTKLTGNWRGKLVADLLKANINSLCEWGRGGERGGSSSSPTYHHVFVNTNNRTFRDCESGIRSERVQLWKPAWCILEATWPNNSEPSGTWILPSLQSVDHEIKLWNLPFLWTVCLPWGTVLLPWLVQNFNDQIVKFLIVLSLLYFLWQSCREVM
jgi:hypothetical protein